MRNETVEHPLMASTFGSALPLGFDHGNHARRTMHLLVKNHRFLLIASADDNDIASSSRPAFVIVVIVVLLCAKLAAFVASCLVNRLKLRMVTGAETI